MRRQACHAPITAEYGFPVRVQNRVDRSLTAADLLREETSAWLAARAADGRFRRFGHHFEVLGAILDGMLTGIREQLLAVTGASSEAAYARCFHLDTSLSTVKRLFEWYAPKYDQRLDPLRGPVLAAADEVVRSCWWQPFDVLGRRPPAGPLPYLDPMFDAFATPRKNVPRDLVDELVRELPIPVISLPAWAARQAWWLVVAAHETGHLVMHDLDLAHDARLVAGDWADEMFADAYSVLMVGDAAAWMVEELQHGLSVDTLYYPPPAERLALLADPASSGLLGLQVDGRPLRELGQGFDEDLARRWTSALATNDGAITKVRSRAAARTLVAAGVAAFPSDPEGVHATLLEKLPQCGPDGTMGAAPAAPSLRELTGALTRRLL